jgi:Protein of unknown function (DUF3830)
MPCFLLTTANGLTIRFNYYQDQAPATVAAFSLLLPFTRIFCHARISGQEIWIDDAPQLDIIQENASIFTEPGEVVYGPLKPTRTKTSNCMGIYYGEGKGVDSCNIFARVHEDDLDLLKTLGEAIWKTGTQTLQFAASGD